MVCPAGKVRDPDTETCKDCPQGSYRSDSMDTCASCGDPSMYRTDEPGSTSVDDCRCEYDMV